MAGALATAVGMALGPTTNPTPPSWVWWGIFAVSLAVAPIFAFHRLRVDHHGQLIALRAAIPPARKLREPPHAGLPKLNALIDECDDYAARVQKPERTWADFRNARGFLVRVRTFEHTHFAGQPERASVGLKELPDLNGPDRGDLRACDGAAAWLMHAKAELLKLREEWLYEPPASSPR